MNRDKFFLLPFEVDVEIVPEKLHTAVLGLKTSEQCESKLMTIFVELYTHQDEKKKGNHQHTNELTVSSLKSHEVVLRIYWLINVRIGGYIDWNPNTYKIR